MSNIFSEIILLPEFEKDKKKLIKRYRTLDDDLKTFIDVQLKLFHKLGIDNNSCEQIENIGIANPNVYKVKKFACKALKGKGVQSEIRIIYSYFYKEDKIEFIEMYYKGDKENENRERIIKLYKK